jgi:signal transduction histidine kinase/CheY-like chemotaxis protein
VLGPEGAAPFMRVIRSVVTKCRAERIVYEVDRADSHRWFLARVSPIRSIDGSCGRVCMLAREITEQKHIEQELRKTRDEAEQANAAKSEFLSRMSHELRTPLNAIIGFAQLAEADARTEEERDNITQILYGGRHLLQLINEILDISRIEAGRVEIAIQAVALQIAASAALSLVQPLAAERNVQLADFSCPYYILADSQRLEQVLLNLLSNAIKYNKPGGRVELQCHEMPHDMLRLAVSDTGVGISNYDLPKLFQPFERLASTAAAVEGVGLGLAICDRSIRSMGGTVGVTSEVGTGSTFWFELPIARSMPDSADRVDTPAPSGDQPAPTGRAKTLLYIEDNLPNVRLVERILSRRPALKMIAAQQGSIGLELARHHQPDLILLDVRLPDMQGDEVLTWLRTEPRTRHIPVVVISADAIGSEVERLKQLGACAYITKPFEVGHFLELLDQALAGFAE